MSKSKSGRVIFISNVIKLDPNVKTPTKADFDNQAKNSNDISSTQYSINKRIFGKLVTSESYHEFYLSNGKTTEDYARKALYMEATEKFFGFEFYNKKKLLFEISCSDYYNGQTTFMEYIDGEPVPLVIDWQELYNEWIHYCKFVDNVKEYVELNFPNYSNKQLDYVELLKKSSKLYPNSIVEDLYNYLHQYGLNQHKQAKANYLAQLELPHINKVNSITITELYYQNMKK